MNSVTPARQSRISQETIVLRHDRLDCELLGRAAAPLPLFHPDRKQVRAARDELVASIKKERDEGEIAAMLGP